MLGLLFAGAKRDFDKVKLHFTVYCFYIEKRLSSRMLNLKRPQICVTLCKGCLQMKSRASVVKNWLTDFSIGFLNLVAVCPPYSQGSQVRTLRPFWPKDLISSIGRYIGALYKKWYLTPPLRYNNAADKIKVKIFM